jgi:hypothetical protein
VPAEPVVGVEARLGGACLEGGKRRIGIGMRIIPIGVPCGWGGKAA